MIHTTLTIGLYLCPIFWISGTFVGALVRYVLVKSTGYSFREHDGTRVFIFAYIILLFYVFLTYLAAYISFHTSLRTGYWSIPWSTVFAYAVGYGFNIRFKSKRQIITNVEIE